HACTCDAGSDLHDPHRAGKRQPARIRHHHRRPGDLRRPGPAARRDAVRRPGPPARGRDDRGGPGRGRGGAAAPVLPAHACGHQAAGRRGGPGAGCCNCRAHAAEPGRRDCDMTDQADLERRYRRLLAWYPPEFRRENGQEILAVLMAGARDGQRRPGLAESADLIRNGVWMRLRPSVPQSARTVQAAVRLMYAGAAVSAVGLIIGLALLIVDMQTAVRGQFLGRNLAAYKPFVITVSIAFGLVVISVWLWMARANGQGRNWARIVSTVLSVLATLQLRGAFTQPVSHAGSGVTVLYYGAVVPFVAAWLVAAAALWLLWCPASTAFFKPPGSAQALH